MLKELNIRVSKVECIINMLDNTAELISGRRDTYSNQQLQQIQEDRDKLRIESEFYTDIIKALQAGCKKLSQEEIEEGKYKAKEWWKRRNPK